MSNELMLKVDNVYKRYRLGTIGGGTLAGDLQSAWARLRKKEDPNTKIGAKAYSKNEVFYALNGINFEVKKGEAVGIIGGNGAGKSTLLKLISQVTAPTDGNIYLNGRVASLLEVGTGFHPELTGRENIYLNGAILGMTKAEIDSKIEDIIDFSEVRQFIDTPVKRYSSGMYVKLAFSVAAHLDSEIILMDEVLAVGDMQFQEKCISKMKSLSEEDGRTILYVSHNMNTIRQLCDRCIVLQKGEKIFEGDTEEAIQLYLGKNQNEWGTKADLASMERPRGIMRDVVLQSFEFEEKQNILFYDNEKLKFSVNWQSKKALKNVKFKLIIRNASDVPIGVTSSDILLETEKDGNYKTEFEFDISTLIPEKYYASLSVYQTDTLGHDIHLDNINRAFAFQVLSSTPDTSQNWKSKYWGNIKFSDMKIKNICQ